MGLAQSVMRISALYPGAVPVVLWDGHAEWRKSLCPEYKANRKDTPEKIAVADSWRQQQPLASALLLHMGVIQMRAVDAEADDLAGRLCLHETPAAHGIDRVTMVSGDTDWWQELSSRVDWFTPITDKPMTQDMLRSTAAKDGPFAGPDEYLLAKALAGDPSDNIPGVPGVGIATALKLLRLHGGLLGIQQAVEEGRAKDKKSTAIAGMIPVIQRNLKIMDWSQAPEPQPGNTGVHRDNFDVQDCQFFCDDLGLHRLSERLAGDASWDCVRQSWELPSTIDFCLSAC